MMSLLQSRSISKTGRRVAVDLQKAERALNDGLHQEAEQLCHGVLEEQPDSCQACLLLADLRFRQQRFDEAEAWVARAREVEPDNPRGLNLSGRLKLRDGDLVAAEVAFRRAVEVAPEYADALANLGHVLLQSGEIEAAEELFHRAIRHDGEHGLANLSLGQMYHAQHRPDKAVPHLQAGIQRELSHRAAQRTLAESLWELGRLDESVTAYRRLAAAGDTDPDVYCGLARALEAMGDLELAMAGYEAALELDPNHGDAAAALSGVLLGLGRTAAALAFIAPRAEQDDAVPSVHLAHARALRAAGHPAAALLQLANLVKRPAPASELAPAHRLLGELLDERGEHKRAFAQFARAQQLRPVAFDPAAHREFVSRLIEVFDRETIDSLPQGLSSEAPVFVLGLPCAGQARVAALIAAHPRAASAGALPHIDLGAGHTGRYNNRGLAYPECMRVLRKRELRELSAAYLARLFLVDEGARRIVDSMWLNFLHVGMIELMFPQARLVHCVRDPLDVGLGCYFRGFDGLPAPFSGRFEDFGSFHAEYLRLMAHWRATTRLPMLDVDYAALVSEPEAEGRRIIEFLGLEWDASVACAAPGHPGPDAAREGRPGWHRDYAEYLGPLRDSLAAAGSTTTPG
jgi:tetratricopeptide (TPR) repeat protein